MVITTMSSQLAYISDVAAANSTVHTPLPSSSAIRLMTLQPGERSQQISCHLQVVPELDHRTDFEALSYCWGGGNDFKAIVCNNAPYLVTHNVYDALKILRRPRRPLILWVDAICINQNDVKERNQQVAMMKQIYTQASRVHVWLGLSSVKGEITAAAGSDRRIAHDICRPTFGQITADDWLRQLQAESDLSKLVHIPEMAGTCCDVWHELEAFFACEWFRRIWVVQEVQSCHDAWLLYDEESIEWPLVALVVRWITCDRSTLIPGVKPAAQYRKSWRWKSNPQADFMVDPVVRTELVVPFLYVLYRTRCFRATDPRDMIFAMLHHPVTRSPEMISSLDTSANIEARDTHLGLQPDYSKTASDVFVEVAVKSIQSSRRLEILSYCWCDQPATLSGHDWVPRWDIDCTALMDPLPTWMYNSCASQVAEPPSPNGRLLLQGLIIGHLSKTACLLAVANGTTIPDDLESSCIYIDSLRSLARVATHDRWVNGRELPSGASPASYDRYEMQMADFAAWLLPRLATAPSALDKSYISGDFVWCNECGVALVSTAARLPTPPLVLGCDECDRGQFDLCTACFDRGLRCYDADHTVHPRIKRGLWVQHTGLDMRYLSEIARHGSAQRFGATIRLTTRARTWFATDSALVGSAMLAIRPGDCIAVLFGASVPFVLRPLADGRFKLIGDCYIDGMMDGEAIAMWEPGELETASFELS